ncbi:MFS transporter [Rhizomicrobium electricum]|uniref:MFS transporter n=1 Tax=Rhizomicrobium electricum TaxID=480070 RepID=A0ABN1EJ98_9PROT
MFVQAGNALQTDVIGLRADTAFSSIMVGLMMAAYYLGYCAGPMLGHLVIGRVGHHATIGICVVMAAGAILLQPFFVTVPAWIALRVVSGFALSLCYVAIESWIHGSVTNLLRGRVFSIYMCVQIIGMTLAQWLLYLAGAESVGPFVLSAGLFLLAALPILVAYRTHPSDVPPRPLNIAKLFRYSPLGATATVFAGLSWAILFTFGPVCAKRLGFDVSGVGLFMALAVGSGGLLQLPAGWLSDVIGRRHVIALLLGAGAVAGVFGMIASSRTTILVAIALEGAAVFPIYAVAAAQVNDCISQAARVAAAAGLVLLFGLGSLLGPVLCGWVMAWFGTDAFFALMAGTMTAGFALTLALGRDPVEPVRAIEVGPHP